MGCGRVKDGEDGGNKRHQGRGEMAQRNDRAGGTLMKVAGRMGCGKVKRGGDNTSQRKGGERRARWRDRYQGRGDIVEGIGGVGDVDGGP